MQYTLTTIIKAPRARVASLMADHGNMKHWQDSLVSYEHQTGSPGTIGATTLLRHKMGRREVEMTETIVASDLPETLSATYESGKVWNLVENTFRETPEGHTQWQLDTTFKCGGFVGILAFLFPGMFRKTTQKAMSAFRAFAEQG